jgi:hypothetical protein
MRLRVKCLVPFGLRYAKVICYRSRSYFTTEDQSVCLGIEQPCGTCDQILLPVGMLLADIWGLVSLGRPLWREDGSEIYSAITQWSCGTCDQILLPVGMLLSEICGLVSVGRPLWREDGSAVCSTITQWSESRWTRKHTLLSHLRLPQPGGPASCIYISQEQSGLVLPSGTRFPLRRLLGLAGLRWRWTRLILKDRHSKMYVLKKS